ncbi:uncharacterized protein [Oscarella lobularis]|uniref:uncharacterized protein n=1 Tax=Oscarella lobularis TaxID=121494 RepID=UPI0033136B34
MDKLQSEEYVAQKSGFLPRVFLEEEFEFVPIVNDAMMSFEEALMKAFKEREPEFQAKIKEGCRKYGAEVEGALTKYLLQIRDEAVRAMNVPLNVSLEEDRVDAEFLESSEDDLKKLEDDVMQLQRRRVSVESLCSTLKKEEADLDKAQRYVQEQLAAVRQTKKDLTQGKSDFPGEAVAFVIEKLQLLSQEIKTYSASDNEK